MDMLTLGIINVERLGDNMIDRIASLLNLKVFADD